MLHLEQLQHKHTWERDQTCNEGSAWVSFWMFLLLALFILLHFPIWCVWLHLIESPDPFFFQFFLLFWGMIFVEVPWLSSSPAHVKWTIPLEPELNQVWCDQCLEVTRTHQHSPVLTTNNAKDSVYARSTFTFLGRLLCRIQVFASEVTLRKHSCFSWICHHSTTRTSVDLYWRQNLHQSVTVCQELILTGTRSGDKQPWLFVGVIYYTLQSTGLGQWQVTHEESLCPYQWVVSRCYDKDKCILLTHATWHTTHEWPQIAINHPSPRSHQGRQNSALTRCVPSQIQIRRDLSIFPAPALEGSVSLSAYSYLLK